MGLFWGTEQTGPAEDLIGVGVGTVGAGREGGEE